MKLHRLFPILTVAAILTLPSCLGGSADKDYSEWRTLNTQAFNDSAILTDKNGKLVYTTFTPDWDKSFSVLLKWHNDYASNPNKITPLSTSTCHVKYTLTNIQGDTLDSSASFKLVPNSMITGFMAAVMEMRVNDTITAVIPYIAGYGAYGSGSVYPYSTLVFGIRLDSISKLL